MDKLFHNINTHRDLSPSTFKNYVRSLNKISAHCECVGSEFIGQWEKVLNHITDAPTKKPYKLNILNCYIVAMDSFIKEELEEFGSLSSNVEVGLRKCRKFQADLKQELDINKFSELKNEKENKNWVSFEELEKSIGLNFKALKDILKRTNLDHKAIHQVQKWVISALYASGKENPPMRLDFNNMIIINQKEYDKLDDPSKNYLVIKSLRTKHFVLNEYKTFKKYGTKTIKLGVNLNKTINKYMKIRADHFIKTDLLLFNNKYEPLSESLLSGYVGEAFAHTNKKINANLIRHIFITDIALHCSLAERNEIAKKMLHNLEQQLCYNKKGSSDDESESNN